MRIPLSSLWILLLIMLIPLTGLAEVGKDLSAKGANMYRSRAGQVLTKASSLAPEAVVMSFLRSKNINTETLDSLVVTTANNVNKNGVTHIKISSVTSSSRFDVTIQALNSFFRCVT